MLSIEKVSVSYKAVQAVREVSLTVKAGEIVALLGPNGAGKSSTLAAIMGLIPVAAGQIIFQDRSITGLAPEMVVRRGMTLVPEGRRIFPDLTVEENLRLGGSFRRDRQAVAADLANVFEMFPILKERRQQSAGTLSGGEQQQLAVARALLSDPSLLLLDEPSLGLAPQIVDTIFELIAELHRKGMTILLVEQNVDRSLKIADRAYVFTNGRVIISGSAEELATSDGVERAYMGLD
jgi:branched-chain amino acid transport system ATP-binding protein